MGMMEEKINAHIILVGKFGGKRNLGRPVHRCENDITKHSGRMWSEFIWLRMGTNGGLL
jgi:hypothetical protein